MTTPVLDAPLGNALARLAVGNAAAGPHVLRQVLDLAFLTGFQLPRVADVILPAATVGTETTIELSWHPSPGVAMLRVAIEFHRASASGASGYVAVLVAGATWYQANGLDGGAPIAQTDQVLQDYPVTVGWLDVSAVARGAPLTIRVTHLDAATSSLGVRQVRVCEVPLAVLDPVGTPSGIGVDAAWPSAGNPIVDGSTAVARGFVRLVSELDKARERVRRHWQLAALRESSGKCVSTSSATFANPSWSLHTSTPTWRIRPRQLFGTADKNKGLLRIVYACSSSSATGTLRLIATPVGGAAINYDVTLPANGVVTFQTLSTAGIDLPCDGTLGVATLQVQAKVTAGTLYLANVAWIEREDTGTDPATLSPTVLLDADALSTGAVTSWSNAGTAGGTFDSSGSEVPVVTAAGPGGRKWVDLAGGDAAMWSSANLSSYITAPAYTWWVVFRADVINTGFADSVANNNDAVLGSFGQATGSYLHSTAGVKATSQYNAVNPTPPPTFNPVLAVATCAPLATSTWYILEQRHDSGTLYVSLNGANEGSVAAADTTPLTQQLILGRGPAGQFLDGGIAYVAVCNTAIDAPTRADVRTWLAARYGLTTA